MSQHEPSLRVSNFTAGGSSVNHIGNNNHVQNNNYYSSEDRCIADLRCTNARDDKTRIERTKGGLFEDSYVWVLSNREFLQWRDDPESHLLWVKGDPGKGKTMLLCGIINELEKEPGALSYFFCQATDERINNATAVLRSLISMLIEQEPSLISHLRKRYDEAGKRLFEDANAWDALSNILSSMLVDPCLRRSGVLLVVDALDECTKHLDLLLELIVQKSVAPVKWLVSSRNWPSIEKALNKAAKRLSLELNEESVSTAVAKYVQFKVGELAKRNDYTSDVEKAVKQSLLTNANGTFLWVALVCQELIDVSWWEVEEVVEAIPSGLDALYERMIDLICGSKHAELCIDILAAVSVVYRPLTLDELPTCVARIPLRVSNDSRALGEMVGYCGSFLTLRERTVFFVHHSAKDFLMRKAAHKIFPSGLQDMHHTMFSQSLHRMSKVLRRDMYNLVAPGALITHVAPPDPDPLAGIRYSSLYWVDHLHACDPDARASKDLQEGGSVSMFLQTRYLYWLEALSLTKSTPKGVASMLKLEKLLQAKRQTRLGSQVHDACRFILYFMGLIEDYPLQLYASALIFSPTGSITRQSFSKEAPSWVVSKPSVDKSWSSCLLTLEEHTGVVHSVAWSPDGSKLASGAADGKVKILDSTGRCLATYDGFSKSIHSVAWSHDGTRLAVAPNGDARWESGWEVRILDPETKPVATLEGHSDSILCVAWSCDHVLASASGDKTIKLWNAAGVCLRTIEGHKGSVQSVTWAHDAARLASASSDRTVKIWDRAGHCLATLQGHSRPVRSVAWSCNNMLASASDDCTVRVWDPTGRCLSVLTGHSSVVHSVAWSHDGTRLASGSDDWRIMIWEPAGQRLATLKGHRRSVRSVAWSHDDSRLVSAAADRSIKTWDPAGQGLSTPTRSGSSFKLISWSHDASMLVSVAEGTLANIWNARGWCLSTLSNLQLPIDSIAWSHNDERLAFLLSASSTFNVLEIKDERLVAFRGHTVSVRSVAWSHDDTRLASMAYDLTIKIWDPSGQCLISLSSPGGYGDALTIAWSHDDTKLASSSQGYTAQIWDVGKQRQVALEGHINKLSAVAWSHDDTRVASASYDYTVKVWDLTGQCLATLGGWDGPVCSVVWSHDDGRLAAASTLHTVKILDMAGMCLANFDITCTLNYLQFDESSSDYLQTQLGILDLHPLLASSAKSVADTSAEDRVRTPHLSGTPHCAGYSLNSEGTWVTSNGQNILWLPSEYRPSPYCTETIQMFNRGGKIVRDHPVAVRENTVAIGCASGRVVIIQFSKIK